MLLRSQNLTTLSTTQGRLLSEFECKGLLFLYIISPWFVVIYEIILRRKIVNDWQVYSLHEIEILCRIDKRIDTEIHNKIVREKNAYLLTNSRPTFVSIFILFFIIKGAPISRDFKHVFFPSVFWQFFFIADFREWSLSLVRAKTSERLKTYLISRQQLQYQKFSFQTLTVT